MKIVFKDNSVAALLKHLALIVGLLYLLIVFYFYIYLPFATNHNETVKVPNLKGMKVEDLDQFLSKHKLRYSVYDSAFSDTLPPLSVLRQFPEAGTRVKQNRMVNVSLNRVLPPTLPMPDLADGSLDNARAVLESNELKLGYIFYEKSPYKNLVKRCQYKGQPIAAGIRLRKGSVIDLVVGSGITTGSDFIIESLVGDTYEIARRKLSMWKLRLGHVQIMEGTDTTTTIPYIFKQYPHVGDSVYVGMAVDLWLAPKVYKQNKE